MNREFIPDQEDRYYSRAVSGALKILDLLGAVSGPQRLSEIARKTGINKSSVFRFLYTMEATGHITRDEAGRYRLAASGPGFAAEVSPARIRETALPQMKRLRSRFSETVSLGVLFKSHIEVIEVLESPHLIRMSNRIGALIPPHASSLGKAIAAFQDEERQEILVNSFGMLRLTEKTIMDEALLKQDYAGIRKRGWSHDNRESAIEGQCFGTPIIFGGKSVAAVSISFPVYRVLEGAARREMLEVLMASGKSISSELVSGS